MNAVILQALLDEEKKAKQPRKTSIRRKRKLKTSKGSSKKSYTIKIEPASDPEEESLFIQKAKWKQKELLDRSVNKKEKQESVCRICLQDGYLSIFEDHECHTIVENIKIIAGIEIIQNDDLPKSLCLMCVTVLESAVRLRKTAQSSEEILRKQAETLIPENIPESNTVKKAEKSEIEDDITNVLPIDINDDFDTYDIDDRISNDGDEFDRHFDVERKPVVKHLRKGYCKICKRNFASVAELKQHKKQCSPYANCPDCNAPIKYTAMREHRKRHSNLFSHLCEICGKPHKTMADFLSHRVVHFNAFPFHCDSCPYRTRIKQSLVTHMRIHTGDKPHACALCPARFTTKGNLNKHFLRVHEGDERKIKCMECDRRFVNNSELRYHVMVVHSGNRDHECTMCGKLFAARGQLMKHERKVHKRKSLRRSGMAPSYLIGNNANQTANINNIEIDPSTIPDPTLYQQHIVHTGNL